MNRRLKTFTFWNGAHGARRETDFVFVNALSGKTMMLAMVSAASVTLLAGAAMAAPSGPATFSVRSFGAAGDGVVNDAPAIDSAISAASRSGGGVVEFGPGTYLLAGTVHLQSNVTIKVNPGSTITGSASGYDKPESNPNDKYQDYGHSHFHNAMFFGDKVDNVTFTGGGTIDGGGHLITGNPKSGQADKIISITRCTNFTLSGITLKRGGHFAALINGCNGVTSDKLVVSTAGDRDGWNIISTQNVKITNASIAANDDALVFKSDYALGAKLPNGHVTVTNSRLSAGCCNALMFGSETCGDFTDYNFSQITITGAGKSGLGMVSMDGAVISDVHYRDITMSGTKSPIMQKVGTRKRCGNSPGVGRIHDITYDNITGTNAGSFSPTLWGESGASQITNVTFTNVNLTLPGGNGTMGTGVPSNDPKNYNPNSIGTRPAYGWYMHNVKGVKFIDSSVRFSKNDGRPAVIANTGSDLVFDHFTAQRGSNSPADMVFQNITGYCVTNSANTSGGALRISSSGSTSC
ncbi:glycosyl hydrolase family 28 protein [Actinocrispum sp. NPDC049592]|uniref:glycoside hydrolase family 28 protein n=1 Tax=Actinocrispum sp. NPDC049592 TaxID=3154835 RepID=UPI00343EE8E5